MVTRSSKPNTVGPRWPQMQAFLPDLVMTDMMMPDMDGEQLVRRLRSNSRTACVPILVLSANPNAREIASKADAAFGQAVQ